MAFSTPSLLSSSGTTPWLSTSPGSFLTSLPLQTIEIQIDVLSTTSSTPKVDFYLAINFSKNLHAFRSPNLCHNCHISGGFIWELRQYPPKYGTIYLLPWLWIWPTRQICGQTLLCLLLLHHLLRYDPQRPLLLHHWLLSHLPLGDCQEHAEKVNTVLDYLISLACFIIFFSSKQNVWTHALVVSKLFLIMGRITL